MEFYAFGRVIPTLVLNHMENIIWGVCVAFVLPNFYSLYDAFK